MPGDSKYRCRATQSIGHALGHMTMLLQLSFLFNVSSDKHVDPTSYSLVKNLLSKWEIWKTKAADLFNKKPSNLIR